MKIINKTNEKLFVNSATILPGCFIDFIEHAFDTTVINSVSNGSMIITTEYSKRWFDMGCKCLYAQETEEKDNQGLPVIEIFEKVEK